MNRPVKKEVYQDKTEVFDYWNSLEKYVDHIEGLINTEINLPLHDVSCCDFALWLQDNYSTNTKECESHTLPKGYWRKDFTNEHYSITELIEIYNRSCS